MSDCDGGMEQALRDLLKLRRPSGYITLKFISFSLRLLRVLLPIPTFVIKCGILILETFFFFSSGSRLKDIFANPIFRLKILLVCF